MCCSVPPRQNRGIVDPGEGEACTDLITDIQYCEAMARAGLMGSIARAWQLVAEWCGTAAAYVDGLRLYLESGARSDDADAARRAVAEVPKASDRWRGIVIDHAVDRAVAILGAHGHDFEVLPADRDVPAFHIDRVRPHLGKRGRRAADRRRVDAGPSASRLAGRLAGIGRHVLSPRASTPTTSRLCGES